MYHPYKQEYLLQCPYLEVNLDEHLLHISSDELKQIQEWSIERNLFDNKNSCKRLMNLSWLDSHTDTYDAWKTLMLKLSHINKLILYNDRIKTENPIILSRNDASLKAYIYRLQQEGIECFILSNELIG